MAIYTYLRISPVATAKIQQQAKAKGKLFIEKCPVTLPFIERPRAQELLEILGEDDVLNIGDIDKLGDNPIDILQGLEALLKTNATINIQKFDVEEAHANAGVKSVISAIKTLLHMKEYQVQEKTVEGIARAKAEGKYKGGKKGRKMNFERWSERNKDVIEALQSGLTTKEISELTGVGKTQVSRVRKRLREFNAEQQQETLEIQNTSAADNNTIEVNEAVMASI
ncbi:helix-turn-helix domain-containing protein [Flammeovirga sp. MY04]|uniref:helix-turn-helix domain-containing protein n=1 Tax=Flammeovirga sp. MY04 TaxID=1191459 RepID=UPI00080623E3|nr:helix-turn-helix domain-containing protein [Flammeovirga sp. MY04]ANQ49534.1 helix-turn-helix domain-containing protein [Flammeovirga sp. MY04]